MVEGLSTLLRSTIIYFISTTCASDLNYNTLAKQFWGILFVDFILKLKDETTVYRLLENRGLTEAL